MAGVEVKNPDSPDEVRPFVAKGKAQIVNLSGGPVGKGVYEPGWRWSEHVKPLAKTDSCQTAHRGYCLSGRLRVAMDDGTEVEIGPGDVAEIAPGHDAWVVGNESCVFVDFGAIAGYAKPS